MLRTVMKRGFLVAFLPFKMPNTHDRPIDPAKPKDELHPGEIGLDNLKKMFSIQDGEISPELHSVINVSLAAYTAGFFWGGLQRIKDAPRNFIEQNEATRFQSNFHAQRELQNKSALEFMRGGIKLGWRVCILSFIYMSITTSMNAFRNRVKVENYICGGGITGALYKMNLGLKGMVAGAVAGSMLGALNGSLSLFILSMSGHTMNDFYTVQSDWARSRKNAMLEKEKELTVEKLTETEKMYIQKTADKADDINAQVK